MEIKFRYYKPEDYENIKKNLQEGGLFDKTWDGIESLEKEFKKRKDSILVAEFGGECIGNVFLINWWGFGAFLFHLAVRKSFRNQGIGTRLLQEAERRLRKMGAKQVALFVEERNQRLVKYYKSRGYKPFMRSLSFIKVL